ncbi:MAG: CBS domain-containing protein [Candidatus Thermoplasmatota archaeon]|nr:CBS domain-containing protein [Candidatus Thermoplasmatota archaeon]MEC8720898.1 CBS domain-containing protein [Candidatus Thermoplasmatota archaeon]
MGKVDLLLKEVGHHDHYTVVDPDMLVHEAAKKLREDPSDVLLVYDRETDTFLGSFYLSDLHRIYANPPKGVRKVHKAMISKVMNTNIAVIDWDANISQAWALVSTKQPSAILLVDESKRFAGYLSSEDLWAAMEHMERTDAAAKTARESGKLTTRNK